MNPGTSWSVCFTSYVGINYCKCWFTVHTLIKPGVFFVDPLKRWPIVIFNKRDWEDYSQDSDILTSDDMVQYLVSRDFILEASNRLTWYWNQTRAYIALVRRLHTLIISKSCLLFLFIFFFLWFFFCFFWSEVTWVKQVYHQHGQRECPPEKNQHLQVLTFTVTNMPRFLPEDSLMVTNEKLKLLRHNGKENIWSQIWGSFQI